MHDEYGPEHISEVYDSKTGMHGFVVIDNTILGPGKGGIRMTPTVSKEEVFRLARAMTWKNALAGLPFGGAKSGIVADSKQISKDKKAALVEAFARSIRQLSSHKYVAAPDMNMAEGEMEIYAKANGNPQSVTGKPAKLGGLPHELGTTGFGVYHAAVVAARHLGLEKATFAVEGFGNVGTFAAKFLSEHGFRFVAASDSRGVIYNMKGIDYEQLLKAKKETGSVVSFDAAKHDTCDNIIHVDADILITAAVPDLIMPSDVETLKFKLIVQGSNIPMAENSEELANKKGIIVIPDFVANAGGVISSYVEYIGGTEREAFDMIEKKVKANTMQVLELAKKKKIMPRDAAMEISKNRILKK